MLGHKPGQAGRPRVGRKQVVSGQRNAAWTSQRLSGAEHEAGTDLALCLSADSETKPTAHKTSAESNPHAVHASVATAVKWEQPKYSGSLGEEGAASGETQSTFFPGTWAPTVPAGCVPATVPTDARDGCAQELSQPPLCSLTSRASNKSSYSPVSPEHRKHMPVLRKLPQLTGHSLLQQGCPRGSGRWPGGLHCHRPGSAGHLQAESETDEPLLLRKGFCLLGLHQVSIQADLQDAGVLAQGLRQLGRPPGCDLVLDEP